MLPVMATANNEDGTKWYGQRDDGGLNLRSVLNRVVSPEG